MSMWVVVAFVAAVFAAVFVLMLVLSAPASGTARMRRTLQRRLERIGADAQSRAAELHRQMAVAEMPGDAQQRCRLGADFH